MPDLKLDYAWAGALADSPTGLPVFKELPDLPGFMAILVAAVETSRSA